MVLDAPPKYRLAHPLASITSEVEETAPELLSLVQEHNDILLYTRSSPHFASISRVWNLNNKAEPLAIARCLSVSAVQRVVHFCSERHQDGQQTARRMPFVVRSGGHDGFNRSTMQDGLMLDVRGLDSISLSSDRQSATIGGGVSGGNLIDFLDQHGLVTPTGYCNTVGYVGWATGGGYGVLAGPYGLGVDQILGATLVDATGNLVDTDSDPHLLWALRGAGTGNFGVIVSMRVRVYERPPYLGGMILFPASEIGQVMSGLRQVTEETGSPDEFSGDCSMGQVSNAERHQTLPQTLMCYSSDIFWNNLLH